MEFGSKGWGYSSGESNCIVSLLGSTHSQHTPFSKNFSQPEIIHEGNGELSGNVD